jgi:4-hydroxy 2-oxovalerate aldolase
MKGVTFTDVTLRDGNHAASHQLSVDHITQYCKALDATGIYAVEVGHGNGLGASSLQLGESKESDFDMLRAAKSALKKAKLQVFAIPGFATIKKDIQPAIEAGADIFRIACHCSEANITERHIRHVRAAGKIPYGVLMMSHMLESVALLLEAEKMERYGAEAVILMDSAGTMFPDDVRLRISKLSKYLPIPIGFHAHNNLGLSVANSLEAIGAGATIIDGTAKGFGAGAGNTPIEILVSIYREYCGINLDKLFDAVLLAEKLFAKTHSISNECITSGISGVFSGFIKHIIRVSERYNVNPHQVIRELGKRGIVGGQEDIILEVAERLSR